MMFLAMLLMPGLRGNAGTSFNLVTEIVCCLKRHMAQFLLLGFLMTVNVGGGILAISRVSAITCAIFQPTCPMIAAGISVLLGMEKLIMSKIGTIMLSVVGAIIVTTQGEATSLGESRFDMLGLLFLCLNVGGGAMYMVYQKASGVLEEYSPTFAAGMSFLVASGLFFIAAIITEGLDGVAWRLGDHNLSLLALCYSVVLTTAFNYSVLAWANKESTPTMVTSFQTLQPIFAALLSYTVMGVLLTLGQAIGGVTVIAGLFLNNTMGCHRARSAPRSPQPSVNDSPSIVLGAVPHPTKLGVSSFS